MKVSRFDVVQRLREYATRGGTVESVDVSVVPVAIIRKLTSLGFNFQQLDGVLQHALLWDHGFVMQTSGELIEMRIPCGRLLEASPCVVETSSSGDVKQVRVEVRPNNVPPISLVPIRNVLHRDIVDDRYVTTCDVDPDRFPQSCSPEMSSSLSEWLIESSQSKIGATMDAVPDAILAALPITSSSSTVTTDDFGHTSSSDLVDAYYQINSEGGSLPRLELSSSVPSDVKERLEHVELKFEDASGLLQRALLWDTGYALLPDPASETVHAIPVYVKCGLHMSDIAISQTYFSSTLCGAEDCSWRNTSSGVLTYSVQASKCTPTQVAQLNGLARCAVPMSLNASESVPTVVNAPVWSIGNLTVTTEQSGIPRLWLRRQQVELSKIYSINTGSQDLAIGKCPTYPSLVIPCVTVDPLNLQDDWCRPLQNSLIATWVHQEENQGMAMATLVVLAGAILLALALDLFADRKPRFFGGNRVGVSLPSITSTMLDVTGGRSQTHYSSRSGWSSVLSVRSNR